jgi:hypothetical protein
VKRSFIHLKEAWYSGANLNNRTDKLVDDVMLTCIDENDQQLGEFVVAWYDLGSGKEPAAKLEIFDDAWGSIKYFDDVLWAMFRHGVNSKSITAEQFCSYLLECGLVDETPVKDPYKKPFRKNLKPVTITL